MEGRGDTLTVTDSKAEADGEADILTLLDAKADFDKDAESVTRPLLLIVPALDNVVLIDPVTCPVLMGLIETKGLAETDTLLLLLLDNPLLGLALTAPLPLGETVAGTDTKETDNVIPLIVTDPSVVKTSRRLEVPGKLKVVPVLTMPEVLYTETPTSLNIVRKSQHTSVLKDVIFTMNAVEPKPLLPPPTVNAQFAASG